MSKIMILSFFIVTIMWIVQISSKKDGPLYPYCQEPLRLLKKSNDTLENNPFPDGRKECEKYIDEAMKDLNTAKEDVDKMKLSSESKKKYDNDIDKCTAIMKKCIVCLKTKNFDGNVFGRCKRNITEAYDRVYDLQFEQY
ncbi:hypothetical protein PGB90_008819 [Kerria lacca]